MMQGADRLRPCWASLPAPFRDDIVALIGGAFVSDIPAHGGFSSAYAGTVTTTADRAFVKAAAADGHGDSLLFLAREAAVLAHLTTPLAPRLLGHLHGEHGTAVAIETVDGHHPGAPWTTADLHTVAESLRELASTAAPAGLPAAQISMLPGFTRWHDIARTPGLRGALPAGLVEKVNRLIDVERGFTEAVRGDVLVHDDVRADNILIENGRARLLDWPHARRGAPWIDLPCLLPSIEAAGGPSCADAYPLFLDHGAPAAKELLPVIAGFASYLWWEQAQPEIPELPGLRAFQRAQALPALRWVSTLI